METLLAQFVSIQTTLTWVLIIQSALLVIALGMGACTAYLTYQVFLITHHKR